MFTAHYCDPLHCTDFTDGLNCVCFFGFASIIIILFYLYYYCIMYLLPCHGEIKIIKITILDVAYSLLAAVRVWQLM